MDTIVILVEPGGILPKINGKILTSSALTNEMYELTVKKIVDLRWNKKGDLVVEVSGTKKKV